MTYNGWANYESWAVALWIDNSHASYHYWRERATEAIKDAPESARVRNLKFAENEAARLQLADELRESFNDETPIRDSSIYADLLNAALGEVDWFEIADHLLAEATEP